MKKDLKCLYLGIILMSCLIFSGCATLMQVPLKLVEAPLVLVGQLLKIVRALPKPPPWIFF